MVYGIWYVQSFLPMPLLILEFSIVRERIYLKFVFCDNSGGFGSISLCFLTVEGESCEKVMQ